MEWLEPRCVLHKADFKFQINSFTSLFTMGLSLRVLNFVNLSFLRCKTEILSILQDYFKDYINYFKDYIKYFVQVTGIYCDW